MSSWLMVSFQVRCCVGGIDTVRSPPIDSLAGRAVGSPALGPLLGCSILEPPYLVRPPAWWPAYHQSAHPGRSVTMIGHSKWDLDQPALLPDLAAMDRNIERMAATFRQAGVGWRPHTKAIKIPAIAHKLLRAGAFGITCAKVCEADVMVA